MLSRYGGVVPRAANRRLLAVASPQSSAPRNPVCNADLPIGVVPSRGVMSHTALSHAPTLQPVERGQLARFAVAGNRRIRFDFGAASVSERYGRFRRSGLFVDAGCYFNKPRHPFTTESEKVPCVK